MNKLLSANLSRLWKNKLFWVTLAAMLVVSVISMLKFCQDAIRDTAYGLEHVLDGHFFNLTPVLGLFFAVFIALFVGTEYSDGTMRNKLVIGHSRANIYLANLLTGLVASLLTVAVWLLGGLVGIPTLGFFEMGLSGLLIYLLIIVLFTAALTAIFTLISMLCSNKAATAVICMLLFFGLLMCAGLINSRLEEPELYSGLIISDEDGMRMGDPMPNPDYLSGSIRGVYQAVLDILPTGQAILIATQGIARPLLNIISSALFTLLVTVAGIFAFKRKDLS